MDEPVQLAVYSQVVSSDACYFNSASSDTEKYSFPNRLNSILSQIQQLEPDIVALNGIDEGSNASLLRSELKKLDFNVKEFHNLEYETYSVNVLAVANNSEWVPESWEHAWLIMDENDCPQLNTGFYHAGPKSFGRCAAITYLRHDETGKKVCVATTLVTPFGLSKQLQQKAFLSLNLRNTDMKHRTKKTCGTILLGGFNKFYSERNIFRTYLPRFHLKEAYVDKLVISWEAVRGEPSTLSFQSRQDIGTYCPRKSSSSVFEYLLSKHMYISKLDAHLYTNDPALLKLISCEIRPTLLQSPDIDIECPPEESKVRHLLADIMSSEHMGIFAKYHAM